MKLRFRVRRGQTGDGRQRVLTDPPLWPAYRWLGVWPLRRSPVRFGEDPREWVRSEISPDDPPRLPSWRSLRRAQRKALGTVIYARQACRFSDTGLRRDWSNVVAVAYRASLRDHWVTDWDALQRVERNRTRQVRDWTHLLSDEDRSFLDVMRMARGDQRWEYRVGQLARSVMGGEFHPLHSQVDLGWIVASRDENRNVSYEVSVAARPDRDLLGVVDDYTDAWNLVVATIEQARDRLAVILGDYGPLGVDLAACRHRWPRPDIRYIAPAVDRRASLESLRRLYENLRDQQPDQGRDDEDGTDPD